jgi:hypothetical protein
MCPSTEYWRDTLAHLAREVAEHGADGIYVEDVAASQAVACEAPTHSHLHEGSAPGFWAAAVRGLLEAIRAAIGGGPHLAVDGPAEPYADLVDAYVTQHPAAERAGVITEDMGPRCAPIPLFSAVYHDYATLIGPAVSLVNQRPHDPLWPREVIAATRSSAEPRRRDYQAQFCLEVARAAIWGHYPILENFVPGQTRDDANRHKMAFLAATVRASAWGVGALLPFAEFMGPLAIESSSLDIELLIDGPPSVPSQRRSIRRAVQPVLGTAWRVPGGSPALVLTNMDARPQDFAARLRSGRLGVQLPLRMTGRVFSEDGDTPAPRLSAAGSEISGNLPGRSVLLMSLR